VTAPGLAIRALGGDAEALACARMMAATEPWITLRRSLDQSMAVVADRSCETFVLTDESSVVGFVVLSMAGSFRGYIRSVCVRPERRGEGLGRRLLAFAEERIFRESPNVFMCVSTFNHDARRLYDRLGYAVVGELTEFMIRGHGELLLRKTRGPWSEFQP
jgi:ribosomal protein S18 acetylase RimI-like enzyme